MGVLTLVAATSVAMSLKDYQVPNVDIKYINDVLVDGFKVSGSMSKAEIQGDH